MTVQSITIHGSMLLQFAIGALLQFKTAIIRYCFYRSVDRLLREIRI